MSTDKTGREPDPDALDDLSDLDLDLDAVDLDVDLDEEPEALEGDDDWDAGGEEDLTAQAVPADSPTGAQAARRSKTKSSSAGLFVVVGGVVLLGAVGWFAFSGLMGGSAPTTPRAPPPPATLSEAPAPTVLEPPTIE
ncbi:MAG TPA: hypothetical protein DDX54_03775, partial [Rhodospirillaceae bacterium]|nr:hypothetical protein [Rhodospirillaceae bacterium]